MASFNYIKLDIKLYMCVCFIFLTFAYLEIKMQHDVYSINVMSLQYRIVEVI